MSMSKSNFYTKFTPFSLGQGNYVDSVEERKTCRYGTCFVFSGRNEKGEERSIYLLKEKQKAYATYNGAEIKTPQSAGFVAFQMARQSEQILKHFSMNAQSKNSYFPLGEGNYATRVDERQSFHRYGSGFLISGQNQNGEERSIYLLKENQKAYATYNGAEIKTPQSAGFVAFQMALLHNDILAHFNFSPLSVSKEQENELSAKSKEAQEEREEKYAKILALKAAKPVGPVPLVDPLSVFNQESSKVISNNLSKRNEILENELQQKTEMLKLLQAKLDRLGSGKGSQTDPVDMEISNTDDDDEFAIVNKAKDSKKKHKF